MKDKLVFSIIIPLYNKEKYIARAVYSALNQSFKKFEIIIVNDGSTDNSLDVVKKIKDPRIKIINQKNLGASNARNTGIKKAKAAYIAFLDADDEYMPDFLSDMFKLTDKYKNHSFFASAYTKISAKSQEECYYGGRKIYIVKNFLAKIAKTGKIFIHISSVVIKKSVFSDIGYFFIRSNKTYCGATIFEDIDLWIRISLKYDLVFLNKINAVYYTNTNINTVKGYKFSKMDCCFYEKTIKKLSHKKVGAIKAKYLKQILYYLRNASATQLYIRGYFDDALHILKKQPQTKNVKNLYQIIKIKNAINRLLPKG